MYEIPSRKGGLHREDGKSAAGIITFPVSLIVLMSLSLLHFNSLVPGGIGIMALTYGDSMAALIGTRFPMVAIRTGKVEKTLSGCMAMFIFSAFAIYIYILLWGEFLPNKLNPMLCIIFGIIASLTELFTPSGFDNLTIPLAVFAAYVVCVA